MSSVVSQSNQLADLIEMLTYRRPGGSGSEKAFIKRFIKPMGVCEDAYGNLYKRIGSAPVLWSSHTDTVHKRSGRQTVVVSDGYASVRSPGSNCLGADCTAGVFVMIEMIKAGVEGLYVFHRDEETGGHGSEFIANETPDLLAGIRYAIAFDRRATGSVITHQWNGRCCSDTFAKALGSALGMGHKPDSGGSFTDTANYTHLVDECTNVSIGFYSEHTAKETLDTSYVLELLEALKHLEVSTLPTLRVAGEVDDDATADYTIAFDCWKDDDQAPKHLPSTATMVRDNPNEVADFLEEYGLTPDEVASLISMRGGWIRSA